MPAAPRASCCPGIAGALAVLVGDATRLEISGIGEDARVIGRVVADSPAPRPSGSARRTRSRSHRVVVDEHQRCRRPMFSSSAIARRFVGLVGPVGNETGEVGAAQHRVRVPVERFQRVRLVVLRADRQDDAAAGTARGLVAGRRRRPRRAGCPGRVTMPSSPSSPITPPHNVLSRSSTRHFADRPCLAASQRPTRSP